MLASVLCANRQGVPADAMLFNPAAAALYEQEAKEQVDAAAARTFLKELDEARVPSWVVGVVDRKLLEAAAR